MEDEIIVDQVESPEIVDDFELGEDEAVEIKDKEANKKKLRRRIDQYKVVSPEIISLRLLYFLYNDPMFMNETFFSSTLLNDCKHHYLLQIRNLSNYVSLIEKSYFYYEKILDDDLKSGVSFNCKLIVRHFDY